MKEFEEFKAAILKKIEEYVEVDFDAPDAAIAVTRNLEVSGELNDIMSQAYKVINPYNIEDFIDLNTEVDNHFYKSVKTSQEFSVKLAKG